MPTRRMHWLNVNNDVSAEFRFWKRQFVLSASVAVGFAIAAGIMIALWSPNSGSAELREFVRDFWTLFVECAFWLGFLIGLLWAGAMRFGAALAGTLPWQSERHLSRRAIAARYFGQSAAFLGLAGICLWLTQQFAALAQPAMSASASVLEPLTQVCLASAIAFSVVALAGREPPAAQPVHDHEG